LHFSRTYPLNELPEIAEWATISAMMAVRGGFSMKWFRTRRQIKHAGQIVEADIREPGIVDLAMQLVARWERWSTETP